MSLLLACTAGVAMALSVLLLMASVLALFAGIGRVELTVLSIPAIGAGVWAGRRVADMWTRRYSRPRQ